MKPRVQRRFPRLGVQLRGVLVARGASVPVTLVNVSPTGAQLVIHQRALLRPRLTARVQFSVDGHDFDLPATIVWTHRVGGTESLGAQLRLEAATASARAAFAEWIVGCLRRTPRRLS